MSITHRPRLHRSAVSTAMLIALLAVPTLGQGGHPARKRSTPVPRPGGPTAVSQDFGDVAVVVDNGLIVTRKNAFDLNGVSVRFDPAGAGRFAVSSSTAVLDPAFGPALTFGYPGATLWPGDDDTQEVAYAAGFPFFGTTYRSVWVNADGNVTFGAPEFASDDRDKAKQVLGPPRISAYLLDVNPANAFNTAAGAKGSIHAVVKSAPDRLVVTWNDVADYQGGTSSTFQLTLYATGSAVIAIDHVDPAASFGVTGISAGGGLAAIEQVDLGAASSTWTANTVIEAFAALAQVSDVQLAREFYKSHPDKYDFLTVLTDFSADGLLHHHGVSNRTHGIGIQIDPSNGESVGSTEYDSTAAHGSAGELESVLFMNNVFLYWPDAARLIDPPISPFSTTTNIFTDPVNFGAPTSLDGQTMPLVRMLGTVPNDGGELSRYYAHGGTVSHGLNSPMSHLCHEVFHRWGVRVRFVHPTKGMGFDSYDLLGREAAHWSFFADTTVPAGRFPGAPRYSCMEGNRLQDLGKPASWNGTATNLAIGERLFLTPVDQLTDGYSALDLHLMGLMRADDVGSFFYVDDPRSIFNGKSLDGFDPANPLNTAVTMRGWFGRGGFAFAGKRVDLTMANIQDYEGDREGRENPRGRRFWGPRGNLRVRYFSNTRQVDPAGDASITLSESQREIGDEADRIGLDGSPTDVKTMAFVLLVQSGQPSSAGNAVALVDQFRMLWELYGNGPATGGIGKFDTRLDPAIY